MSRFAGTAGLVENRSATAGAEGTRYFAFDLVRGLSALAVVAGHLRAALIEDFTGSVGVGAVGKAFYFVTGFGHQAVMVFFVLSGFFVGGQILSQRERFHFGRYLIARLSRLWVVLLPALLLTLACDFITLRANPGLGDGGFLAIVTSAPKAAEFSLSATTFFGNLAFLNGVLVSSYGSNGPLWSLAFEFCYYLIFPLALLAAGFFTGRSARARGLAAAVVIGICWLYPFGILLDFPIWLFGVGVHGWLRGGGRVPDWIGIAGIVGFGGALVASRLGKLDSDHLVGATFALLALWLANSHFVVGALGRVAVYLSDISYSLYVCHFPLVMLVFGVVHGTRREAVSALSLAHYLGWLGAAVAVGALFHRRFETRTPALRRWATDRFFPRTGASATSAR